MTETQLQPRPLTKPNRNLRLVILTSGIVIAVFAIIIAIIRFTIPSSYDILYASHLGTVGQVNEKNSVVSSQLAFPELQSYEKNPFPFPTPPVAGSCAWWITEVLQKMEGLNEKSGFLIQISDVDGKKIAVAKAFYGDDQRTPIAAEGQFSCPQFFPFFDCQMDGLFKYWDSSGNLTRKEFWVQGKKRD